MAALRLLDHTATQGTMSFLFGSSSDAFTDLVGEHKTIPGGETAEEVSLFRTERATSESIPAGTDDIMLNLEVADKIKGKEVAPDKAMRAIRGRLEHRNPNVQLLALKVITLEGGEELEKN